MLKKSTLLVAIFCSFALTSCFGPSKEAKEIAEKVCSCFEKMEEFEQKSQTNPLGSIGKGFSAIGCAANLSLNLESEMQEKNVSQEDYEKAMKRRCPESYSKYGAEN
jgi:hypothetical protein